MNKLDTWERKSEQLDNDIQDMFDQNSEFSVEIIKDRVMRYSR